MARKYFLNETYFDNINTEEKVYWLGFISADGCVERRNYSLRFNQSYQDVDHIEKLKFALNSNHPIKRLVKKTAIGNTMIVASFSVFSKYLYYKLIGYGIMDRKSLIIKPCLFIPEELERHYWRGYFDGNGCIRKVKKNWKISMAGCPYMVRGFQDFVIKNNLISSSRVNMRGKISVIEFSGNKISQDVAKLLYLNANIYLDRKKLLIDELLKIKNVPHYMQGIKMPGSLSRWIGVSKRGNGYEARIQYEGKSHRSNYCITEIEAASAYNNMAKIFYGDEARLNAL